MSYLGETLCMLSQLFPLINFEIVNDENAIQGREFQNLVCDLILKADMLRLPKAFTGFLNLYRMNSIEKRRKKSNHMRDKLPRLLRNLVIALS